ncbi:RNA polymerase sigma24 factor [Actinorhabdospora filicis]|uniref:RNA polymerase sigma24 factor n=1 Tax=Actinorhabdospora filicis TaxID=1785913 RepID=A0A9W6SRH0_9ACTN|nr:SigE family RNA polymerase sigma factor [Actinorhabdospora filicis]GLZ81001.1 RNA polymerase sigma24 factor [Actinorhabdospora filicis]
MRGSEKDAQYREFVVARADALRRFGYLLTGGDWHRAEDAVQVALTKLYVVWTRAAGMNTDAYVRRILINVIGEERRRAWFRRERAVRTLPERSSRPDTGDVRVTVLSALTRLPARQRAAVVLRFWEDRSIEETAEIMKCSAGTVKSQTARGLQTLRGLLADTESMRAEGAATT